MSSDQLINLDKVRIRLSDMTLSERRILALRSMGLEPEHDEVFKRLNGDAQTPLKQYLETNLLRPTRFY